MANVRTAVVDHLRLANPSEPSLGATMLQSVMENAIQCEALKGFLIKRGVLSEAEFAEEVAHTRAEWARAVAEAIAAHAVRKNQVLLEGFHAEPQ